MPCDRIPLSKTDFGGGKHLGIYRIPSLFGCPTSVLSACARPRGRKDSVGRVLKGAYIHSSTVQLKHGADKFFRRGSGIQTAIRNPRGSRIVSSTIGGRSSDPGCLWPATTAWVVAKTGIRVSAIDRFFRGRTGAVMSLHRPRIPPCHLTAIDSPFLPAASFVRYTFAGSIAAISRTRPHVAKPAAKTANQYPQKSHSGSARIRGSSRKSLF